MAASCQARRPDTWRDTTGHNRRVSRDIPDSTIGPAIYPLVLIVAYVRALENAARNELEKEARRLEGRGVEVMRVLRMGFAVEEILAAVQELDAGLIVVGTDAT